jgi:DNA mismatch endonuclease, patch repair protein
VDIYSTAKRSEIMGKIKGKETKPEILIGKALFAKGYRYRKNVKSLPGKPDLVLPKFKTVIFINGCFWHGHNNCKASKLPATNTSFWELKILSNIERDKRNLYKLRRLGWQVIQVWQCSIASQAKLERTIIRVVNRLKE